MENQLTPETPNQRTKRLMIVAIQGFNLDQLEPGETLHEITMYNKTDGSVQLKYRKKEAGIPAEHSHIIEGVVS